MRQLDTTYHNGMAGYLMDFGFGGFIGYGKGVSVGLVMEELNIRMRYYEDDRPCGEVQGLVTISTGEPLSTVCI